MKFWNFKFVLPFLAFFLSIVARSSGQTTRVEAIYVDGFSFNAPILDSSGIALTAGGAGNGDGAIVQIGYFQGVSALSDPSSFGAADWASFRALTGVGSPNELRHPTSIGDMDSPATGPFGFLFMPSAVAIELDVGLDSGLPSSYPVRLGIRFYDGVSLGESTGYNTATSDNSLWLLQQPEVAPENNSVLNLDLHLLSWESGPSGAFQTALTSAPEPASSFLLVLSALVLARRCRKA